MCIEQDAIEDPWIVRNGDILGLSDRSRDVGYATQNYSLTKEMITVAMKTLQPPNRSSIEFESRELLDVLWGRSDRI